MKSIEIHHTAAATSQQTVLGLMSDFINAQLGAGRLHTKDRT